MSNDLDFFAAPAKLNLNLRVLNQRLDGYHNICTLFSLINWIDEIRIVPTKNTKIEVLSSVNNIAPENNLAFKAATLLQKSTGCEQGAHIRIKKHIPMGAGLGGGSSNAATVMMALNQLWNTKLKRQTLMELGRLLGADVPFFVFGKNALAEGIGEKLSPVSLPKTWYLILHPPAHVSTEEIFHALALTRQASMAIIPTQQERNLDQNDLELIVRKKVPLVDKAIKALHKYGQARMTGSGSCVFLACKSRSQAQKIAQQCTGSWTQHIVCGLARHPLRVKNNWGVAKW